MLKDTLYVNYLYKMKEIILTKREEEIILTNCSTYLYAFVNELKFYYWLGS